ncbi:hypothetical protein D3C87_1586210 [compost metagenome]
MACHSFGYMLMRVKPGSELISLISTSPLSVRNTSTRARPEQPSTWNASTARARMRSLASTLILAGTTTSAAVSSMYLLS